MDIGSALNNRFSFKCRWRCTSCLILSSTLRGPRPYSPALHAYRHDSTDDVLSVRIIPMARSNRRLHFNVLKVEVLLIFQGRAPRPSVTGQHATTHVSRPTRRHSHATASPYNPWSFRTQGPPRPTRLSLRLRSSSAAMLTGKQFRPDPLHRRPAHGQTGTHDGGAGFDHRPHGAEDCPNQRIPRLTSALQRRQSQHAGSKYEDTEPKDKCQADFLGFGQPQGPDHEGKGD